MFVPPKYLQCALILQDLRILNFFYETLLEVLGPVGPRLLGRPRPMFNFTKKNFQFIERWLPLVVMGWGGLRLIAA